MFNSRLKLIKNISLTHNNMVCPVKIICPKFCNFLQNLELIGLNTIFEIICSTQKKIFSASLFSVLFNIAICDVKKLNFTPTKKFFPMRKIQKIVDYFRGSSFYWGIYYLIYYFYYFFWGAYSILYETFCFFYWVGHSFVCFIWHFLYYSGFIFLLWSTIILVLLITFVIFVYFYGDFYIRMIHLFARRTAYNRTPHNVVA